MGNEDAGAAPLPNDKYTVGWICALPHEAIAAKNALDAVHGREPLSRHSSDHNPYILGSINDHNVVIASLPAGLTGTTPAITTAKEMLTSFPNIRFGLMVGIGAGIPKIRKRRDGKIYDVRDIRLGDVVVSQPEGVHGGVFQYDLGKALVDGRFQRSGSLNSPPRVLLNAVSTLRQESEGGGSKLQTYLDEILRKLDDAGADPPFDFPGREEDRLFEAPCTHIDDEPTCDFCDEAMEIIRAVRKSTRPKLHYGVIASGNQVIRDPVMRDRFAAECICFEMEAAGLMNDFPCLVIRGICDYADSHKNDRWQRFAAAAAAACAKEVLYVTPKVQVESEKLAREVLKVLQEVTATVKPLDDDRRRKEKSRILNWLSQADHNASKHNALKSRREGTAEWIFSHPTFCKWHESHSATLFCPGIPGCGKTMLASVVIEYLTTRWRNDNVMVAFLYFKHYGSEQTAYDLLAALLRQFGEQGDEIHETIQPLYETCQKEKRRPTQKELISALYSVVKGYSQVFVLMDGLDECRNWYSDIREGLVGTIRHLQKQAAVKLLATSRDVPDIRECFNKDMHLELSAPKKDIVEYLQGRKDIPRILHEEENAGLRQGILAQIADTVDGMFLLARLYFDEIASKKNVEDIQMSLQRFKKARGRSDALQLAYDEALGRIDSQKECHWAHRVLTWVTHAKRPLTPTELSHALAVRLGDCEFNETRKPICREVVSLCAGLVTIDEESDIVRLVHLTTKQYLDNHPPNWMNCASIYMAASCLTYLTFNEFASGRAPTRVAIQDRIHNYPFLRYAASYGGYHARACETILLQQHSELLQKFLLRESFTSAAGEHVLADRYGYERQLWYDYPSWLWSHYLSYFGLAKILERVISKQLGGKFNNDAINIRDQKLDRTPLHWAAYEGNKAVVEILIHELGPKASLVSQDGVQFTPLGLAVENGHYNVVKLFTDLGKDTVDLNSSAHCGGKSPLGLAAWKGFTRIAELLVGLGPDRVDPDLPDFRQPLILAAANGHCDIVKLLLDLEPGRVQGNGLSGNVPLIFAAQNGHLDVFRLLISYGPERVSPDMKNSWGRTALSHAAEAGYLEIVQLLVNLGQDRVDPNSKNKYGQTPLHLAAANGHAAVVRLLLDLGAEQVDVNQGEYTGSLTPLHYAAGRGKLEVVRVLTGYRLGRVEFDSKDRWGRTPLALAAEFEHYEIVKLLLSLGPDEVDPESTDQENNTPMMFAAENGHSEVVSLLKTHLEQRRCALSHDPSTLKKGIRKAHALRERDTDDGSPGSSRPYMRRRIRDGSED